MRSHTNSGGAAGRLGFVDIASRSFTFLMRLGFTVDRREDTFVRFENGNSFVNVWHGRSSYQVGLELGRVREGETYSLYELLTAVAPSEIDLARCQTTDPEILERCLASMASAIERHCGALLAGDAVAFERLRAMVAPLRRAATLQAQFGAIIDRADKAWELKDFSKAAALYAKCEPALDETRERRLEYLRKHKQD